MQKQNIENYLKTIYHLSNGNSFVVTNKQLSALLNVIPATVTEAVKKLDALKLVSYEKSYGIKLTSQGVKQALTVIRRHRIWETYLALELGFGWEEVHELAEELEHIKNDKLILKLIQKLGDPAYDPHGEPIPDARGNFKKNEYIKLADTKLNKEYKLMATTDTTTIFLKFLDKNNLKIGAFLKVLEIETVDGSVLIGTTLNPVRLSSQMAQNLLVK